MSIYVLGFVSLKIILIQNDLEEEQQNKNIIVWKATPYIMVIMYYLFGVSTSPKAPLNFYTLKTETAYFPKCQ
jgi:Na+/H+ antiporter NhaC